MVPSERLYGRGFFTRSTLEQLIAGRFGTIKLPGAIGTIKLPERQINGSSYMSECKSLKRNGGPYGTIFATFSCHHRQKCSVSCNSCEKQFSLASNRSYGHETCNLTLRLLRCDHFTNIYRDSQPVTFAPLSA